MNDVNPHSSPKSEQDTSKKETNITFPVYSFGFLLLSILLYPLYSYFYIFAGADGKEIGFFTILTPHLLKLLVITISSSIILSTILKLFTKRPIKEIFFQTLHVMNIIIATLATLSIIVVVFMVANLD